MILVDASDLSVSRPGKPLFDGVAVAVSTGDRLGVVGVNGSGKSTLLGVLAGTVEPEAGTIRRGRGAKVTFLDQSAPLPSGTVREVAGGGYLSDAILDRLGMSHLLDAEVSSLSGGEAKRVALARALVAVGDDGESTESDLLILDEPTNHLDIDAITWLEDWLARFRGGLILVTHDRHVLDRLTTRMLEIEAGVKGARGKVRPGRTYVHDGGYASYLDAKAERREREEVAEKVRQNLARSELAWLRRGARARSRKPKADVAAALKVIDGKPVQPERPEELPLHEVTQTPRLGNTVVELHGVGDGYGSPDELLFRDLDLMLDRGARVAVVGPNGSGKSTLLDAIAGRRTPRQGEVVRGQTVRIGYYTQRGSEARGAGHERDAAVDLPQDARVREVVAGPARQPDWSDAALLERFWFNTDTQWAPVRLLSGGERRRLQLVLVLRQAPNVLLLDEPTNDLDLDTLRALEDMLDDWPGALVTVSHDRAFLERTADEVLVMDGQGKAARLPGGYAAYEKQRRERTQARASVAKPKSATPRSKRMTTQAAASPAQGDAEVGKRRSSSTVRFELKQAQTRLNRLERRQAELESEVAAVGSDTGELARVGQELAELQGELQTAEEEWLSLAAEAEASGLRV